MPKKTQNSSPKIPDPLVSIMEGNEGRSPFAISPTKGGLMRRCSAVCFVLALFAMGAGVADAGNPSLVLRVVPDDGSRLSGLAQSVQVLSASGPDTGVLEIGRPYTVHVLASGFDAGEGFGGASFSVQYEPLADNDGLQVTNWQSSCDTQVFVKSPTGARSEPVNDFETRVGII